MYSLLLISINLPDTAGWGSVDDILIPVVKPGKSHPKPDFKTFNNTNNQ